MLICVILPTTLPADSVVLIMQSGKWRHREIKRIAHSWQVAEAGFESSQSGSRDCPGKEGISAVVCKLEIVQ